MIRPALILGFVGGIAAVSGQAPTPPSFEVASIKLNTSNKPPLTDAHLWFIRNVAAESARDGRFAAEGFIATPLSVLIQLAYNVRDFQLGGGPSWVNSERYDVNARAEGPATFEQMRPMLRSLLAERFNLTLRHDTKEMPFYELVPSNDGLQISAMKESGCVEAGPAKPFEPLNNCGGIRQHSTPEGQILEAVGISMTRLTALLTDTVGRIVVDKTGFTELFSIRLQFGRGATNQSAPSIFAALEEQLGLRLRSVKGPIEVLVIDRVARPSPN
jgi:uncharacterized protein (TIGR03435 family)